MSLDCDAARPLLAERLDGPMPPGIDEELEAHLAACAPCRDVAARLEDVQEGLEILSQRTTPDGLAERIAARAPLRPRPARAAWRSRASLRDLARVAGWGAVMITLSVALAGRGLGGRLADGVAPVLADMRQELLRSDLEGEGILSSLDARAERSLAKLTGREDRPRRQP